MLSFACLNSTCPFPDTLLQIRNTVMFVLSTTCRHYAFLSAVWEHYQGQKQSLRKPFPMWLYLIISAMSFHQWTLQKHICTFQDLTLRPGKNKRLTNRLWKFKAKKSEVIHSVPFHLFAENDSSRCSQWPYFLPPNLFLFILFYSDKSSMKHLQPMHISQNYFCQASLWPAPWDMTCLS